MAYLKGVDLSGSSDISGSIGIFGQVTGSSFTGSFSGSFTATEISATDLTVSGTASIGYLETIYETASIIYSSGSTKFGDTLDDTHQLTGSLLVTGSSYTINGEDIIITSALNAATSSLSSSLATGIASDSASLAASIVSNSSSLAASITTNSSSAAADIAALVVDSSSFSTRVTDLESFSSSLDDTFATEAELNAATASLSSSLAVDIATNSESISNIESFPYTGSAIISGSLIVTGSTNISGSVTAYGFNIDDNATGTPAIYSSTNLNLSASNAVVVTDSPFRVASLTDAETGSFTSQDGDIIFNSTRAAYMVYSGSAWRDIIIEGFTASYASQALSSSYAITASYAENVPVGTGFPYTGSAIISGSLIVTGSIYSDSQIYATASQAISSSYAENGGVTSIAAGNGISINQGTGNVTITALATSGSVGQNAIVPFAFAHLNTTSPGSGVGISWSNWNSSNNTMDFTFGTAQSDTNYSVVTDSETFDDYFVGISNKTTTGFRAEFYDNSQGRTPSTFSPFNFVIYSSNPISTIGVAATGSLLTTSSLSSNTLTFTKGDTTTYDIDLTSITPTSASYASNGGVTSITAGSGIVVNQSTGNITISTDTVIGGSIISSSFTNAVTTTLTHNFGSTNVIVAVYDENGNEIIPSTLTLDSVDKVKVTFASPQSGTIVAIEAQTGEFATGSFSNTGSFTLNHSLGTQDLNIVAYDTNNIQFVPDIQILDSSNVKATFSGLESGTLLAVVREGTVSSSFSNTVDTTITHNLSGSALFVTVYDTSYNEIIPDSISIVDDNNINITFATTSSGNVVIAGGITDDGEAGVTSIIAGPGITIDQSRGNVTISTQTIASGSIISSSFTDATAAILTHNFGSTNIIVAAYDESGNEIIPASITLDSVNKVTATFTSPQSGDLVVIKPQPEEFATTSFSSTGSVTLNHSLGTQDLNVVAYDTSNIQFIPDIEVLDSSNVKATFASPTSGKLLAVARDGSVSASFSNTINETITHNLSGNALFVTVYDTSYNEIIPDSISIVDTSSINLTFAAPSSGNVVIAGGAIDTNPISTPTTYTQAISGFSNYTINHNLNAEWPLVQVYESASRAQYVPQSIVSVDANITNITFSAPFNGFVTINS